MPGPYDEDDDVEDVYGIFSSGGAVADEDDVEDVYGIFKTPSKAASSEPMGPPAPPKEWWEDILSNVSDTVGTEKGRASGWRAALQGASQNTADNLVRWADPSFADSLDQAAKASPVMHGLGQAGTGIAAGIAAGPAIGAQMLAQGGLSALSAAADGEGFWPGRDAGGRPQLGVGVSGAGGALLGAGGQMASNVAGKTARALGGTKAGQWAGRQLGRLMPGADDAARVVPDVAPLKDPFVGRRGELARMLPEPVPSGPPPPPSTAIGEDEEALIDLLRRKPPRASMPEYPPPITSYEPPMGTWPPDYAPGKTMRGPMGRIMKRPQPGGTLEPVPERPPYGPPPAAELPYESPLSPDLPAPSSPGERLLRMDAPEPAPRPATLSEPPLPIEPPLRAPEQPLDLAFEPGPPRTPRMETAPYDVPRRVGASSAGAAEPAQRTMFHDLHDTMKLSPSYRKALGAVKLADRAMNMAGGQETNLAAQAGRAGFELAQETGLPGLFDQKVNAQDYAQERPAVADLPTLHYALQATLASGRAGLSPEDEQALTEAVVQGDQAAISAIDFRLRQRYPAYARRVERELRAYNEED